MSNSDNIEIKASELEAEISLLEEALEKKKTLLSQLKTKSLGCPYTDNLSTEETIRYSRQIIMPQITKVGQVALKTGKVLIVGIGGLGCPAASYLTSAGVGEIHIVDYDEVDLSNLHRQILHYEGDMGRSKVNSAYNKLKSMNSNVKIVPLRIHVTSSIVEHIENHKYDVILDCTDNAPTRYLLNDVCVFHNIPLVSGSALQLEGQLTVYHYENGPCYRCLFPVPPPAHTVTNCGDGGVLGPVAGVIGVLQALETIKILTKMEGVLSGKLLLFDGSSTTFRNVKLRSKMDSCDVCGQNPKIKTPIDYEQFCGSKSHDKVIDIDVLKGCDNVHVNDLKTILSENKIVVDVRSELEYDMCKLPNTFNIPYPFITTEKGINCLTEILAKFSGGNKDVYMLCRRGNDSQRSVESLRNNFPDPAVKFFNIKGGLHAYSKIVDPLFPAY